MFMPKFSHFSGANYIQSPQNIILPRRRNLDPRHNHRRHHRRAHNSTHHGGGPNPEEENKKLGFKQKLQYRNFSSSVKYLKNSDFRTCFQVIIKDKI